MKKIVFLSACLLAVMACEKKAVIPDVDPQKPGQQYPVSIVPVMTKVTQTAFEQNDAIGVTITRTSGAYATNEKMVFDGSVFSGSLKWYAEGTDGATVAAYYPYAASVPSSFTVQADQSNGVSSSDFVAGIKEGVLPSAYAVAIPFKHKLSLIILNVTNNSQGELASIALQGAKLTAKIAADFTATVDEEAAPGTIVAGKVGEGKYALAVPPQTVALTVIATTAGGSQLSQVLKETALEAGKQYSISMIVNPEDIIVALSGDIEDWSNGGEIEGDDTPAGDLVENLADGYITYHGDKYTVAKMKDNKWWMTQNMRYVPEGYTPSSDLTQVTAGIYNPVIYNVTESAAEFSTDDDIIEQHGYFYQTEVAMGLKVGDLPQEVPADDEALAALRLQYEGIQGICPKGWHIPTLKDIMDLVGRCSGQTTNKDAPYYDNTADNCLIDLLNADNFNMDAYGAINIASITTTTASFIGGLKTRSYLSSGYYVGSTIYKVNKNSQTGAFTTYQFYALMPNTNKDNANEFNCNGAFMNYRVGANLRCVRND